MSNPNDVKFRKIGEASYSEVFGIGDVVLKVIPLRDENPDAGTNKKKLKMNTKYNEHGNDEEDGPAPSDAKDVLKEIVVTRAMGELCNGFVNLLRTYVVRGRYPELLLELWDEFYERRGSESVRPGMLLFCQGDPGFSTDGSLLITIKTRLMSHRYMLSLSYPMADLILRHTLLPVRTRRGGDKHAASSGRLPKPSHMLNN
jgi:hypothetical protein